MTNFPSKLHRFPSKHKFSRVQDSQIPYFVSIHDYLPAYHNQNPIGLLPIIYKYINNFGLHINMQYAVCSKLGYIMKYQLVEQPIFMIIESSYHNEKAQPFICEKIYIANIKYKRHSPKTKMR